MNVKIKRQIKTELSSIGQWFIEDNFIKIYSLEDRDRGLKQSMSLDKIKKDKIKFETAIPITDIKPYEIIVTKSDRFTKQFGFDFYTLQIVAVPGFDGIRIHWGNDAVATDGCPLTGKTKGKNFIGESRVAYNEFLTYFKDILGFKTRRVGNLDIIEPIKDFIQKEKVYLTVESNY